MADHASWVIRVSDTLKPLSLRQAEVLEFMLRHREDYGALASQPDIAEFMGAAKAAAFRMIQLLERRGYLCAKRNYPYYTVELTADEIAELSRQVAKRKAYEAAYS